MESPRWRLHFPIHPGKGGGRAPSRAAQMCRPPDVLYSLDQQTRLAPATIRQLPDGDAIPPTSPQPCTSFIMSAVYRSPATLSSLRRASVSFRSASVSCTAKAPMLSSKYLRRLLPGIG